MDNVIDKPSFRDRITAIDRACKVISQHSQPSSKQQASTEPHTPSPTNRPPLPPSLPYTQAGYVDVLDLLVSKGAELNTVRLNRQMPAHGAAIQGHAHVLKRLHELGADVLNAYDDQGKSPLDYAVYFCHKDAAEYLRKLNGNKLTRWEEKRLLTTATKMQALRRGNSARKEVLALKVLRGVQDDKAVARTEAIKEAKSKSLI